MRADLLQRRLAGYNHLPRSHIGIGYDNPAAAETIRDGGFSAANAARQTYNKMPHVRYTITNCR